MESLNGIEISDNTRKKVSKAIELLREASHEEKVDLQDKVKNTYSQAKSDVTDAAKKINKDIKLRAHAVDEQVKNNPWKFIGLTAAVSILTGFFFGKRK